MSANRFDKFFERITHKGMRGRGVADVGFYKRRVHNAVPTVCKIYVNRDPLRQTLGPGQIEVRKHATELSIVKTAEMMALLGDRPQPGDSVIIGADLAGEVLTISSVLREDDGEWYIQCK